MNCPEELIGAFVATSMPETDRGVELCGLLLGTLVSPSHQRRFQTGPNTSFLPCPFFFVGFNVKDKFYLHHHDAPDTQTNVDIRHVCHDK